MILWAPEIWIKDLFSPSSYQRLFVKKKRRDTIRDNKARSSNLYSLKNVLKILSCVSNIYTACAKWDKKEKDDSSDRLLLFFLFFCVKEKHRYIWILYLCTKNLTSNWDASLFFWGKNHTLYTVCWEFFFFFPSRSTPWKTFYSHSDSLLGWSPNTSSTALTIHKQHSQT